MVYSLCIIFFFFFSSRRRHTRSTRDWSSDVCSSDLGLRQRVRRVETARPIEAKIFEHLLHVRPVGQAIEEAARRAETGRVDADPHLECRAGELDIVAEDRKSVV